MKRILLIILLALFGLALVFLEPGQYLNFTYLKAQQASMAEYYAAHPGQTAALYFSGYILVTALSIPGAAIMTLAGGLVFGLGWGTVLISFASSIGATLAFLVARFLLRDTVQRRFGSSLQTLNTGMEKDGAFYLFTLRLIPVFPFFVINLAMGLTPIRTLTYYLVSQVGMLPATIVFVNAGTQIATLESPADILSPQLIGAFALLGIFPWLARLLILGIKRYQIMKNYQKPAKFDRNLIVIGAGSGGLVASYIAAALKAKVTLIEKHKMGGDCLNSGCVPSKALISSARFIARLKRANDFGIRSASADFDFADIMERVQRVISEVAPHDSIERYTKLGVEVIEGEARMTSPYSVEVNGQTLTTRSIIIATGARPFVPPIPGIADIDPLTSDNLWELRELPKRLVVLGGGPIGCELSQTFARLGSEVTQVEMAPRIMLREDPEISEFMVKRFEEEGVRVRTGHQAKSFHREGEQKILVCEHEGKDVRFEFDQVIVAVGRAANTQGFGLEELEIPLSPRRTVEVNQYLQTIYPNIYACGDVAGPYQFTHTAGHQAWYAAVNALLGFKKFAVDYSVIPWATFTEPEVARVGINEQEAKEQNIAYEVTTFGIDDLDRAIASGENEGVVKVLTIPGRDRILGVTIMGEHAGELITEFIAAMRHKRGLKSILSTIHIYPTLSEANKFVAGEWRRAHAPAGLLRLVERFLSWRRG